MAKGVEDTAFYRWSRLVALNEVGGEPDDFPPGPDAFHGFAGGPGPRLAGQHDHAVHPRHQAAGGCAGPARGAGRDPGGLGGAGGGLARPGGGAQRRGHAGAGHRVPAVADPGRGVAPRQRPAGRLPAQGDARGQDRHLLDRPGRGLRGGRARARGPGAGGRGAQPRHRRLRGRPGRRRAGELTRHEAGPADHARRGRRLPGLRAGRPVPGGPGQPPAGGLRPPPPAARRAGRRGRRRPGWMRRSCWSPRPRCGCAAGTRTGSPGTTSRWPPRAPRRVMPWRSPAAARR